MDIVNELFEFIDLQQIQKCYCPICSRSELIHFKALLSTLQDSLGEFDRYNL
jgi:hypothetical protein